jgi:hypothetical protein
MSISWRVGLLHGPVPAGVQALTTGPASAAPHGGDGMELDTLTVREPSLDDVFIALIGRHAKPVDQGDATEGEAP